MVLVLNPQMTSKTFIEGSERFNNFMRKFQHSSGKPKQDPSFEDCRELQMQSLTILSKQTEVDHERGHHSLIL